MTRKEVEKLSPVRIVYGLNCNGGNFYAIDGTAPFIEIQVDLCPVEKRMSLLHEIGHAIHHADNCRCMQNRLNHTLAEYHTYRFVMKYIKGNKKLIKAFVADIDRALNNSGHEHKTAAKRIIKLKSYAKLEIKK